MITLKLIDKYNPCKSGRSNLIRYYGKNFKYTIEDFFCLEHIPYDDKLWIALEIIPTRVLSYWALACASSQLDNTNDNRVRECLETVEQFLLGKCSKEELEKARSAAALSAWSAARSAADSAAESAMSAAWSAARSADSAAESALSAARSAARINQQEVNLILLIECINEVS